MEPKEKETPAGVGPGITGASGDMIEGTGHDQGVGGTGHDNDADAAGMRPQDQYTARPDAQHVDTEASAGTSSSRPGGSRNVSPANDNATDPDHVHEGGGQGRSPRGNHIRAGNPGTDDEH